MWERFSYYGMRALLILFMTAAPATGGLGFDTGDGRRRLRPVHVDGVPDDAARRLDRRPADRPAAGGALRRHPDRERPLQHGVPVADDVLSRPRAHRHRHGLLKGNISVIVGQLYRRRRRPARRRLLDLLHGHQPRRVPRAARLRLSRAARQLAPGLRRGRRRHGARPRSSTSLGGKYLGDAGLHPAPASLADGRSRAGSRRAIVGRSALARCWSLLGRGRGYTGVLPVTPTQIADAAGYLLLVAVGRSSSAGCSSPATGRRSSASGSTSIGVLLPGCGALLVGVRAGRVDAEPLRRPQHAQRRSSAGASRAAGSSRSMRSSSSCFAPMFAWLWVTLGPREPSSPTKFALGLIGVGARLRDARAGGARAASDGAQVSPLWLIGDLPAPHLRRAVPEPGRPELDDQARAGAHRRPDDGRLVPRRVGRQLHRRPRSPAFYEAMPLPSLFGAVGVVRRSSPASLHARCSRSPLNQLIG